MGFAAEGLGREGFGFGRAAGLLATGRRARRRGAAPTLLRARALRRRARSPRTAPTTSSITSMIERLLGTAILLLSSVAIAKFSERFARSA